jgi:hypothetical protein
MNYRPVEKSQVDVKYAAVSVLIPNREEAEFIKSRCSLNIRKSQFDFIWMDGWMNGWITLILLAALG